MNRRAVIVEVKITHLEDKLSCACDDALKQIAEKLWLWLSITLLDGSVGSNRMLIQSQGHHP